MSSQLDILALEPFYGGVRRAMLETVVRCSRHRWTLLKLPPRRIERRLSAAANWFSEQLSRHWGGRVDLLFTSEAMNLADLLRLSPSLSKYPSVVYFHDNQLPDLTNPAEKPLDLVNLNTASAATEIWFNSRYHKQTFAIRASALVDRHPELSNRNPMANFASKSRLMPPPVDWGLVEDVRSAERVERNWAGVFFETRGADMNLLNGAFALLRERGTPMTGITIGPVKELDPLVPRVTIAEQDDIGQVRGMLASSVVLSAKPEAASDYQVIRALIAGCRPVLPDAGVYPEILPAPLHAPCLFDVSAEGMADWLEMGLEEASSPQKPWRYDGFRDAFRAFDAIPACRAFDERLEQLVAEHARHE